MYREELGAGAADGSMRFVSKGHAGEEGQLHGQVSGDGGGASVAHACC